MVAPPNPAWIPANSPKGPRDAARLFPSRALRGSAAVASMPARGGDRGVPRRQRKHLQIGHPGRVPPTAPKGALRRWRQAQAEGWRLMGPAARPPDREGRPLRFRANAMVSGISSSRSRSCRRYIARSHPVDRAPPPIARVAARCAARRDLVIRDVYALILQSFESRTMAKAWARFRTAHPSTMSARPSGSTPLLSPRRNLPPGPAVAMLLDHMAADDHAVSAAGASPCGPAPATFVARPVRHRFIAGSAESRQPRSIRACREGSAVSISSMPARVEAADGNPSDPDHRIRPRSMRSRRAREPLLPVDCRRCAPPLPSPPQDRVTAEPAASEAEFVVQPHRRVTSALHHRLALGAARL